VEVVNSDAQQNNAFFLGCDAPPFIKGNSTVVILIHVGEEAVKPCFRHSQTGPLESISELALVYYAVSIAIDAFEEVV